MKTKPWTKQTHKQATLLRYLNRRVGMTGYLATFISTRTKRPTVKRPKIIRQRTVAESHGYVTPPYCMPKRNINVPPTMSRLPRKSIAFKPSMRGVLGVLRSRKKKMIQKATPSMGRLM